MLHMETWTPQRSCRLFLSFHLKHLLETTTVPTSKDVWKCLRRPSEVRNPSSRIGRTSWIFLKEKGIFHSHGEGNIISFWCSVTKSYPTLCNPMDCSTPGFPDLHHLPEFAQTHVHWVGDAIQPSHLQLPFIDSKHGWCVTFPWNFH